MDARSLARARQAVAEAATVTFLTGAGISAAAGLRTYRGAGGLYESGGMPPLHVSDLQQQRLPALWAHLDALRAAVDEAVPTAAHRAIAEFSSARPGTVTVATQNVDGLHRHAGGHLDPIELHGSLRTASGLGFRHRHLWDAPDRDAAGVPRCPACGSRCRPDVVLFGERLDGFALRAAEHAAASGVLVVVGTSLEVFPAAGLVQRAAAQGVPVVVVNTEPSPVPAAVSLAGPASQVVPELLA